MGCWESGVGSRWEGGLVGGTESGAGGVLGSADVHHGAKFVPFVSTRSGVQMRTAFIFNVRVGVHLAHDAAIANLNIPVRAGYAQAIL